MRRRFILLTVLATLSSLLPVTNVTAATGDVTRVSTDSAGAQVSGPSRVTNSLANGLRAMSDDGRYVAFESESTQLVPGDTNGQRDIFVKDRQTGATSRVNVTGTGTQADTNGSSWPGISADGRYVVFQSSAASLDQNSVAGSAYYLKDMQTGSLTEIGDAGGGSAPAMNGAGGIVAFATRTNYDVANDTNDQTDIYKWSGGTPTLISLKADGSAGTGNHPSVDTAGDTIAFYSSNQLLPTDTNPFSDIYVNDGGGMELLTPGTDDNSQQPSISGDGRYVAFTSWSTTIVSGIPSSSTPRIYLHDRDLDTTVLVSRKTDGSPSTSASSAPVISRDGSLVVFASGDGGLVAGDTNGSTDVFAYKVADGTLTRVSTAADGSETCCTDSTSQTVDADGSLVAFASTSAELTVDDTNAAYDVFVKELGPSTPPPPTQYTLQITKDGTGTGTVASEPAGINCGSTCSFEFDEDTSVTLTATHDAGSTFTGWGGPCSGTGSCIVTMDQARAVTATFTADVISRTLTVTRNGTGTGTVTSASPGITCGSDCSEAYDHGTEVILNAAPTGGSSFTSWTGCTSATGTTCTVSMTANKTVTATFTAAPQQPSPIPAVSVGDATVTEGNAGFTTLRFPISVHGSNPNGVSVRYETQPGSATQDVDYRWARGAVYLPPGASQGTIEILVEADQIDEDDETFDLRITLSVWEATPAAGWRGYAIGTIVDDDVSCPGYKGDARKQIIGTERGELLRGTSAPDIICGLGGDDWLIGLDGNDILLGGDGEDIFEGGSGDDTIDAGDDADTGSGEAGNDSIVGGAGDDELYGGDGSDSITGGAGNDAISGEAGDDTESGGDGDDTFYQGTNDGKDMMSGDAGTDTASYSARTTKVTVTLDGASNDGADQEGDNVGAGTERVVGGSANDELTGSTGPDTLEGGPGDDRLKGGPGSRGAPDGADVLVGGAGLDELDGGAGGDSLLGGAHKDLIVGGAGNDDLVGGPGPDVLHGGADNDDIRDEGGDNTLSGGDGNDLIRGGIHVDVITGGRGRDDVEGGEGADRIYGGDDDDVLAGDEGDDLIVGDNGNDTLYGRKGKDELKPGRGDDNANGGDGDDKIGDPLDRVNDDPWSYELGDDRMFGGDGNDLIHGGVGNDNIYGEGDKDNILDGGVGNDTVSGGNGPDAVMGGSGNDHVYGGDGADFVSGEFGDDHVYGGAGRDDVYGRGYKDPSVGHVRENDALFGGPDFDKCEGGDRFEGCELEYEDPGDLI